MDALRPLAIPPGDYFMPRAADMKEMRSADRYLRMAVAELAARARAAPVGRERCVRPGRCYDRVRVIMTWQYR